MNPDYILIGKKSLVYNSELNFKNQCKTSVITTPGLEKKCTTVSQMLLHYYYYDQVAAFTHILFKKTKPKWSQIQNHLYKTFIKKHFLKTSLE